MAKLEEGKGSVAKNGLNISIPKKAPRCSYEPKGDSKNSRGTEKVTGKL